MLDINKYRKINKDYKTQQEANEERKANEELIIIENIIDKEIAKDPSITHVSFQLDLHTKTVKLLQEQGFIVAYNNADDMYNVSWEEEVKEDGEKPSILKENPNIFDKYKKVIDKPKVYTCQLDEEPRIKYQHKKDLEEYIAAILGL